MYTNGSETGIGVGAAATPGNSTESASLPNFRFVFTAKTHAIYLALNTISATRKEKFAIFTDSRNCLQALQKQNPTNLKVRKLKHNIANLQKIEK